MCPTVHVLANVHNGCCALGKVAAEGSYVGNLFVIHEPSFASGCCTTFRFLLSCALFASVMFCCVPFCNDCGLCQSVRFHCLTAVETIEPSDIGKRQQRLMTKIAIADPIEPHLLAPLLVSLLFSLLFWVIFWVCFCHLWGPSQEAKHSNHSIFFFPQQ